MGVASKLISPLAGIRVLDLTRILAGPFCTMLLGDLGAEVIKVERTGCGDETRAWRPPEMGGESCYFFSINRNKKSICIDLKYQQGVDIVRDLAKVSDVLVENFLPGTMDKMDLGYKSLSKMNPGLVFCSVTGYGQTGPWSNKGGYDVIASAVGGLMGITGPEGGPPCKVGVAQTDLMTGVQSYAAILAALLQRTQTGHGQWVETDLLSTQVCSLANISSNYLNAGVQGKPMGTAHPSIVPYQSFETRDGRWLVIGACNDRHFWELCDTMDLSALNTNPKFTSNELRVKYRNELLSMLSKRFLEEDLCYWSSKLEDTTCPHGPVNSLKETFDHPQVKHQKLVHTLHHETAGDIKVTGSSVRFSESCVQPRYPPPLLGQHTDSVLCDVLNYDNNFISDMKTKGIIQ